MKRIECNQSDLEDNSLFNRKPAKRTEVSHVQIYLLNREVLLNSSKHVVNLEEHI